MHNTSLICFASYLSLFVTLRFSLFLALSLSSFPIFPLVHVYRSSLYRSRKESLLRIPFCYCVLRSQHFYDHMSSSLYPNHRLCPDFLLLGIFFLFRYSSTTFLVYTDIALVHIWIFAHFLVRPFLFRLPLPFFHLNYTFLARAELTVGHTQRNEQPDRHPVYFLVFSLRNW